MFSSEKQVVDKVQKPRWPKWRLRFLKNAENWLLICAGISFTRESFKWSCLYLCVCVYVAAEAVISAIILVVLLLWWSRIIHFSLGLIIPAYEANSLKTEWNCRQVYFTPSHWIERSSEQRTSWASVLPSCESRCWLLRPRGMFLMVRGTHVADLCLIIEWNN